MALSLQCSCRAAFRYGNSTAASLPSSSNVCMNPTSSLLFQNTRLELQSKSNRKVLISIRAGTSEELEAEKSLIEEDAMERMEKSLEATKSNFNTIRTGRASPLLLDRIEVEYYGTSVLLKTIAQVTAPDGSTVLVQPFDKSSLSSIEKAISTSDLGITPSNDGSVIRLFISQPTADRRKELAKQVAKLAEDGKVALRNIRRDAIKSYEKLNKDKKISDDNLNDWIDDMNKLTDSYGKKVEEILKQKEKELSSV